MSSKAWYKSKTLWTNFGAVIAAVGVYFETGDLTMSLFPAALALLNVILRLVTKQPVG